MPDKKKFTPDEKTKLLQSFGEGLNDQSLRIIDYFKSSGKDINKMLVQAYKYKAFC